MSDIEYCKNRARGVVSSRFCREAVKDRRLDGRRRGRGRRVKDGEREGS